MARVAVIPTAVYRMPLRPARNTLFRFMPNPSSTTEACSRYFVEAFVSVRKGLSDSRPSARPTASASGGDAQGLTAKISPKRKTVFESKGEHSTLCFTRPGFYHTRVLPDPADVFLLFHHWRPCLATERFTELGHVGQRCIRAVLWR